MQRLLRKRILMAFFIFRSRILVGFQSFVQPIALKPFWIIIKHVKEKSIEKNSDLGAELVSDLFAEANKGEAAKRIVKTGGSTLNTPYSAGLTGVYNAGIAYINMTGTTYGSITYYVIGQPKMYLASKSAGTWSGWNAITTNADINYTSSNVENNYNNYIKGGLYQITGAVATNSPTGQAGSGGILIVFEAQAYVIQFAFNLTTAYYRRYTKSPSSWSAWKTFTSN